MKPILFNTDMVRAILDGRKTVTRRVVKFKAGQNQKWTGYIPDGPVLYGSNNIPAVKAPYKHGEILYVRETWCNVNTAENPAYFYRADNDRPKDYDGIAWRPSIHMPKDAARIFLRVTDVQAERLQHIGRSDAVKEGANPACAVLNFKNIWDSTIKPADLDTFGWDANPWVWVIEFERCDILELV